MTERKLWNRWVDHSGALVGAFVGMGLFGGVRRALAYKTGWLDGRFAMMAAMDEAARRDMSGGDWLRGELARQYAVMGFPPPDLDDEGDE